MANSSGHLVWVLSPELENWDLQFRLRATEYRINLTAGRIALRMGDLVSRQRHLRFNVGIRECIEDLYDEANAKLSSTLKTEPQGLTYVTNHFSLLIINSYNFKCVINISKYLTHSLNLKTREKIRGRRRNKGSPVIFVFRLRE
jgi:hypothetical protein